MTRRGGRPLSFFKRVSVPSGSFEKKPGTGTISTQARKRATFPSGTLEAAGSVFCDGLTALAGRAVFAFPFFTCRFSLRICDRPPLYPLHSRRVPSYPFPPFPPSPL